MQSFFSQFGVVPVITTLNIVKGAFLMSQNSKTVKLVTVAFFMALEIVLNTYLTVNPFGIAKIGLGFLPIAVIAIMYGPIWAGAAYALGDIIGVFLLPQGPYFPGFTITALLSGIIFGLVFYKKEITWKRSLFASLIVVLTMDLILNTFWLHVLMGQGFIALLPTRLVKCAITLPVETILIPLVWNKIFKRIPAIKDKMHIA